MEDSEVTIIRYCRRKVGPSPSCEKENYVCSDKRLREDPFVGYSPLDSMAFLRPDPFSPQPQVGDDCASTQGGEFLGCVLLLTVTTESPCVLKQPPFSRSCATGIQPAQPTEVPLTKEKYLLMLSAHLDTGRPRTLHPT